uniref:Uncharacterized protein n=1 Tax=Molossus molossus TaxID=27622 RepID=A0A7J8BLZ7_MOLMO|nr:hypothetical protein HJG59_010140 [Molossus molossus]
MVLCGKISMLGFMLGPCRPELLLQFAILLQQRRRRWDGHVSTIYPSQSEVTVGSTPLNPVVLPKEALWGQETGQLPAGVSAATCWPYKERHHRRTGEGGPAGFGLGSKYASAGGEGGAQTLQRILWKPWTPPCEKPHAQISADCSGQTGGSHTRFLHPLQQRPFISVLQQNFSEVEENGHSEREIKMRFHPAGVAQWLSVNPAPRGRRFDSPVRTQAQAVGQIPSGGRAGGGHSMFSLIDVSVSLSLSLPL